MSVYSASGELTSPGYPSTYFPQPAGCTKDNMEVAEGFNLAMKLKFQTQCCADYTTWKDDLITVSDGNHTVLFNQTAGFRLNTEGEVLFNSVSHSASLEFCKVSGRSCWRQSNPSLSLSSSTWGSTNSPATTSPTRPSSNLSVSPNTIRFSK